jgi:amino acid adenylation domain-containing protein
MSGTEGVEAKRELLRTLLAKRAAGPRRYPTSFAQERLWFLDRLVPGNPFYNVEAAIPVEAALDPDVLERVVNEIVQRHAALRTTFVDEGTGPVQVVAPEMQVPLQRIDLRHLDAADQQAAQLAIRRERARTAFDLERGPLLITDLLRLGDRRWLFLLNMHHIVSDGWSMGVFSRELTALYEAFAAGKPSPLPALKLQYGDFAAWQRTSFSGEALAQQLAYWRGQLEGLVPLDLPTDRARPPLQSHRGAFWTTHLDAETSRAVQRCCREQGATPFMVLLAAFDALLARYSGRDDVAVGTYIANRDREELEPLIGFFLNTLVLRTRVDLEQGFGALVRCVKETALGAYAHQALPFATLVQQLAPDRDLSRNPLVQVVFQLQNASSADAAGSSQALVDYQRGAAIFDIAVTCYEAQGQFHATWEYATDLFDEPSIAQMARHFERMLAAALANPAEPLHRLPLMEAAELRRILVDWNAPAVPIDAVPVTAQLDRLASQSPASPAFIDGEQQLSAGELADRSRALAAALRERGLQPGAACGVCLPRGLALPVALFAVWRAGAAYLPLDPTYPPDRLGYMLADSKAQVLIGAADDPWARLLAQRSGVALVDPATGSDGEPELPPAPGLDAVSHIIYTSGSTGRPKAAPSPHRQVLNRLQWMARIAPFGGGEVGCVKTSISFIDSLWELLGALLQGRPSVLVPTAAIMDPPAMIELLARHGVSRLWLVPSYLRALLDAAPDLGARLPALRFWVASGEVLPVELQRRFELAHPQAVLFNLYGTSEVWDATWHDPRTCGLEGLSRIPIGRPIDNASCFVLDRWHQPVPAGVVGDLHVGGHALGPRHDSPRRLHLTLPPLPAQDVWACGDSVRWRHDGSLEFVGRSDAELKVRGMRVEPAEIESVLMEHPAVRRAAVLAWPGVDDSLRLVAYVEHAGPALAHELLRAFAAQRLPAFMLPECFVAVSSLPHTGSGKVDRTALRLQGDPIALQPPTALAAQGSATEQALGAIWHELLGRDCGLDDNFFAVGGHSLLAAQVVTRIQQRLGVRLDLRRVFESPSLRALAAAVDELMRNQTQPVASIPRADRRALPVRN